MMNKKVLYVAVVATLGLVASGANAAVATYGSELAAGSDLASNTWNTLVTPFAPTTANPLYLTFKLTNGASFNTLTSASLVCTGVVAGTSGVLTPGNIQLAAGGAGTGFATFVVTAISAAGMMEGCTITNGTAHVGSWPVSVGETVSAVYGNALATPTMDSTALYSAASLFTNTVTAAANTALVATGFISFSTANAVAGSNSTTAKLGGFKLLLNSNLLSDGALANASALSGIVTAITISLAGTPLAAANASTGSIFITYNSAAAAAGSATCADTILVSAAAGASITFSAVSPSPAAGATSGYVYAACMGVSGAVIPVGTITVGVAGVANNDVVGTAYQIGSLIAAGTTIGTITHNGASTTVLNLPRSIDPDAGFLRVYNTSSLAGNVAVTIYSQAGGTPLVQNCALTPSLAANGVLVMSVAQVVSTCGFTEPASGRYRMDLVGAFPTMRAQGLVRSAGVLVNVGGDTSTNNN